jgi:1,4-dihydroxy-6-naphthoate synthase
MKITVAHSPDSDDAFMHYGLASGKVSPDGFEFDQLLADIETLNKAAFQGKYEVSAVSFHAYAYLTDRYALLPHGSSMGDKYGPRLVALQSHTRESIRGKRIAIPGPMTTAYLALKLYQPDFIPVPMPFDQIEAAVLDRSVDLGLLIHEGQLTYAADGLTLVQEILRQHLATALSLLSGEDDLVEIGSP